MSLETAQLDKFKNDAPLMNGQIQGDAEQLAEFVEKSKSLIAELPEKVERTPKEHEQAAQIMAGCRKLRIQFIDRHAEEVYALLTNNYEQYLNLSELIYLAAIHFPFLVPTREQIASEHMKIQAWKEGYEIDQGIFFRGILRSQKAGSHLADAMLLPTCRALDLLETLVKVNSVELGTVFIERDGEAAHITINNQHCLNAEDNHLIDDLQTAVDLVLLDDRIKVGVIRGGVMHHLRYQGKRVFCSGINLSDLQAGKISFVDFLLSREFGYISKIRHGIIDQEKKETIQKPWIAVVDSHAIGGGMQLLLVVDKVIAAENSYFSLPAAQEGIVPGAANLRLPPMAGYALARQLILSGKKLHVTDTNARWLCDNGVPDNQIGSAIADAIEEYKNPAVTHNRKMLVMGLEPHDRFREYMAEFSYVQATRLYSQDVLEKISRWAKKESA